MSLIDKKQEVIFCAVFIPIFCDRSLLRANRSLNDYLNLYEGCPRFYLVIVVFQIDVIFTFAVIGQDYNVIDCCQLKAHFIVQN